MSDVAIVANGGANIASLRFALDDQKAAMPDVVRALVEAGAPVLEVTAEDAPLEDVYFTLVEGSEPTAYEAG